MKQNSTLKKTDIKKALKMFPEWSLNTKETELSVTFVFTEHLDALVFIARITVHAQVLQHYPEIVFSEKKVKVKTTTTAIKGLSKLDFALADKISHLKRG